jgi:hypothetical protein
MSGKEDFMWWVAQMLRPRWRQPTLIRWLEAAALFGIALTIRFSLGPLYGAIPFLSRDGASQR